MARLSIGFDTKQRQQLMLERGKPLASFDAGRGQGDDDVRNNLTIVQNNDTVSEFDGFIDIVRDQQHCRVVSGGQATEQDVHAYSGQGIERAKGLVCK